MSIGQFLFPAFMTDSLEYRASEELWTQRWSSLIENLEEADIWTSPWLGTTYGDGTPMLDGNPIFSAYSPLRRLGVRVIQLEPAGDPQELSVWADKFASGEAGEISELVIACVLSRESMPAALDLMAQWVRWGEVSVIRRSPLLASPPPREGSRRGGLVLVAEAA
jgi:hypothetical protein